MNILMTRSATASLQRFSVGPKESHQFVTIAEPQSFQPSSRYSDQPVALSARLGGLGGTAAIALMILCAALFTWRNYAAPPATATLKVFSVAPPAAPPEPVREVPPGPDEVEKEEPRPDQERPRMEPPKVAVPSLNGLPVIAAPPAPEPPVKETTAPERQPAPPAPQLSTSKPSWEGLVLGALNKVKRYPRNARFARQQGVPYIRFVMNREGKVLVARIERSSGHRSLDEEALALPGRAQPLPRPPEEMKGDTLELVVPVEFFMR